MADEEKAERDDDEELKTYAWLRRRTGLPPGTLYALVSSITSDRGGMTSSRDHEGARAPATRSAAIRAPRRAPTLRSDRRRPRLCHVEGDPSFLRFRAAARSRCRSSASRSL